MEDLALDDMGQYSLRSPSTTESCSDPSVFVSPDAPIKTKKLWFLHGHLHSKRYSNPTLISLAALIRHNGNVFKDQTAFLYPVSSDLQTPFKPMTWEEFDQLTENVAKIYADQLTEVLRRANEAAKQPTVALLGSGRTIEFFVTEMALQKLGVRVLLLAEGNSIEAVHHLLKVCKAQALILDSKNYGTDSRGLQVLKMIENIAITQNSTELELSALAFDDGKDPWERQCFVLHTSGSTGMPKPIAHTNRSFMLIARMYRIFQTFHIENWYLLFPLYAHPHPLRPKTRGS
jgi:acyl-coenzyme A synthetase/AMP-(fatty) acid ligase